MEVEQNEVCGFQQFQSAARPQCTDPGDCSEDGTTPNQHIKSSLSFSAEWTPISSCQLTNEDFYSCVVDNTIRQTAESAEMPQQF